MVLALKKETKFFIAWLSNPVRVYISLYWLLKKVLDRLPSNRQYGSQHYPEYIKSKIPKISAKHVKWFFNNNEKQSCFAKQDAVDIPFISLAGSRLLIDNNTIIWNKKFEDAEDEESLHRLNWLLLLLNDKAYDKDELSSWAIYQIEDWISNFLPELQKKRQNSLKWESYTVSERLSNSLIFFYLTKKKPTNIIIESLLAQIGYLVKNVEYKGKYTGNHILNNARAIYLSGVAFNNKKLTEFAKIIFFEELPRFVTEDGFMREGSSHYHFLFTRWFLEVYYFSLIGQDDELSSFLLPWVKGLLEQCGFFLVYDKEKNEWQPPQLIVLDGKDTEGNVGAGADAGTYS